MPYRQVPYHHVSEPKRDVFRRADAFLADVYSILRVAPAASSKAGAGNFPIVLVLLCIVDGLARDVYPTEAAIPEHNKRFKRLVRDKLPWGPAKRGWIDLDHAAKWFYVEFRNPLVHELGKDKARAKQIYEPVIGKWGHVPSMRVDRLDALKD